MGEWYKKITSTTEVDFFHSEGLAATVVDSPVTWEFVGLLPI